MAERLTMQEVIEHCDKTTRLMERVFTCVHDGGEFGQIESKGYLEHKQTSEWLRELQKYKELEEHGRLIELPCAVGDTVWTIDPDINFIDDFKVTDIDIVKEGIAICNHYLGYCCDVNDFGKTVFLTKEEAEAKLKELRCNHD